MSVSVSVCVSDPLQISLRLHQHGTDQLTGQSMLFRLWIDDLPADPATSTKCIADNSNPKCRANVTVSITSNNTEADEQILEQCGSKTVCCHIYASVQ